MSVQTRPTRVAGASWYVETAIDLVEAEIRGNHTNANAGKDGQKQARLYKRLAKRWFQAFGNRKVDSLTTDDLQAFKDSLTADASIKGTTQFHYYSAAMRSVRYAIECGKMNRIRIPPPPKKTKVRPQPWSVEQVKDLFAKADEESATYRGRKGGNAGCPQLALWVRLHYLSLARVEEIWRMVNGQGIWVDTGVFELDESKMERSHARYLLLPDAGLDLLEQLRGVRATLSKEWATAGRNGSLPFKSGECYSQMCRHRIGHYAKNLRHSSAQHLQDMENVSSDDVAFFLGHSGMSRHYKRDPFRRMRNVLDKLVPIACPHWKRAMPVVVPTVFKAARPIAPPRAGVECYALADMD